MTAEGPVLVPIDYAVIGFAQGQVGFPSQVSEVFARLCAAGVIRLMDLVVVQKAFDGSVEGFEAGDGGLGIPTHLEDDVAEVLSEADLVRLAQVMEPGTVAGVVVWANTWAEPMAREVARAGARILASGSISARSILEFVLRAEIEGG